MNNGLQLRRTVNQWTTLQRVFILFVKRAYELSWHDLAKVFNIIFSDELKRHGFSRHHRFRSTSISSQHHELLVTQPRSFRSVWEETTFDELLFKFNRLNDLFISAWKECSNLTITLRDVEGPLPGKRRHPERQQSPPNRQPTSRSHNYARTASLSTASNSFQASPTSVQEIETTRGGLTIRDPPNTTPFTPNASRSHLPTPPSTPQRTTMRRSAVDSFTTTDNEFHHDSIPYLVFRVHDHKSQGTNTSIGFRAGMFVEDASQDMPLPDEDDELFLHQAAKHINRNSVPSPFISVTTSYVWAIRMAGVKAGRHGRAVSISAIDGRAVASQTRLYEGGQVVKRIKDRGLAKFMNYCGRYEYLVYGFIPQAAMVGTFTFESLQALVNSDDVVAHLVQLDILLKSGGTTTLLNSLVPSPLDEHTACAVVALAKLIKPDITFYHPFVQDFMSVIVQNFRLSARGPWRSDSEYKLELRRAFEPRLMPRFVRQFLCVSIPARRSTEVDERQIIAAHPATNLLPAFSIFEPSNTSGLYDEGQSTSPRTPERSSPSSSTTSSRCTTPSTPSTQSTPSTPSTPSALDVFKTTPVWLESPYQRRFSYLSLE